MRSKRTSTWHSIPSIPNLLPERKGIQGYLVSNQESTVQLQKFRSLLPKAMQPHCLEARLKDSKLTVFCDHAGWATRLRFMQKELAKNMGVESVQFRIMAAPTLNRKTTRKLREPISSETAELLNANALEMADEHPRLSKILRRIATSRSIKPVP